MKSIIVKAMTINNLEDIIDALDKYDDLSEEELHVLGDICPATVILKDITDDERGNEETIILDMGIGEIHDLITYSTINSALNQCAAAIKKLNIAEDNVKVIVEYPHDIPAEEEPLNYFTVSALKLKPDWNVDLVLL